MLIPAAIYEQIIDQAQTDWPNETCGVLGGPELGQITSIYPLRNVAGTPSYLYEIDPIEQFGAFALIEDRGEQLTAIYHSHPISPPYPSQIDVSRASYPDVAYIIVSLAEYEPELAAWHIRNGAISPVDVTSAPTSS